jgi:hypothetical protein
LILNIFDCDEGVLGVGDSEDYIGRAVIFLNELKPDDLSSDDRIPYPAWYPVKVGYNDVYNEEGGAAILASF